MRRSVFAEEKLLLDLIQLGKKGGFIPGLILGQCSGQRDYVVHMARTPLLKPWNAGENLDDVGDTPQVGQKPLAGLRDIKEFVLADHAKHVTRMLPGGMWVLGIFIVGPGDLFADSTCLPKLRSLLVQISKHLRASPLLHGDSPSPEKLVLHLDTQTDKYWCKGLEMANLASTLKPVDWKFQQSPTQWLQLDCRYDLEQLDPYEISHSEPLKKQLQDILSIVSENVQKGICTFDGEMKDNADILEVVEKTKKSKVKEHESEEKTKTVMAQQVNLYAPCDHSKGDDILKVVDQIGEMRCRGLLHSRVYMRNKSTIEQAVKAVKEDIVRSWASRLEMHSDSLIEEEIASPEEKVVVHEPPRRVLVPLPHCHVFLSDYLFPGEGPSEALVSLQELLGLNITEASVDKDFEGQPDTPELYGLSESIEAVRLEEANSGQIVFSQSTYVILIGVGLAVLTLLAAIVVQLYR